MVSENKIDAEQGVQLLNALRTSTQASGPSSTATGAHWIRVRVTNMETGRTKVNVNLPMGLVKAGIKLGARFAPEMEGVEWDDLMTAIQEGASGKLVDVEDIEGGEKVEIYVE
jgi:hypothetical protein